MPISRFSAYTQAVLLMLLGFFCFATMDAGAKYLTGSLGLIMALWARYAGQTLFVIALVARRKGVWKPRHPYLQVIRSALLLGASANFFMGLHKLGIPTATALINLNPVLITLGGAVLLRELLGPQRIIGIIAALVGALIVIRPGAQEFQAEMLYPVVAAICFAGYVLTTRYVRNDDLWTSLLYTGLVGGVATTLALPFFWAAPTTFDLLIMLAVASIGSFGQLFVIGAYSRAEAGSIAPFAYSGLIYASLLSILIYAEYPDFWTIIGSLVIALAGIYVWHRETKAKQSQAET